MAKKQKKATKEQFYVSMETPSKFRRETLQGLKSLLTSLKEHQSIEDIRKRKHDIASKLEKTFDDINALYALMHKLLPLLPRHARTKPSSYVASVASQPRKEEPIPIPSKNRSGLEKLEEELRAVEEELKKLH